MFRAQRGPFPFRFPGWVPRRTLVLVMPGRGTLARRNGRAGPDGVVDDDAAERTFRRATHRVPRKARLAHAATVGRSVSVAAPGEPGGGAIARADPVRMGVDARPRANPPLRSPQRRGNWWNAADAFGRQPNAGMTASPPLSRTTRVSGSSGSVARSKALPAGRPLLPAARRVTLPAPRRRPRPACGPRGPSADVRRCRTSSMPRSPARPRTRRSARADTPLRTSATATAAR